MIKYTIYLGLFDKDSKAQKFTTLEAYKVVENLAAKLFEGATVSESHGVYRHYDGTVVVEPSLRIELYADSLGDFVPTIKRIFNQESVLVERSNVNVSFE
jgi:hypothetical protein